MPLEDLDPLYFAKFFFLAFSRDDASTLKPINSSPYLAFKDFKEIFNLGSLLGLSLDSGGS